MYRVLLVDDEPLILSGIKFLIDWEKNGCRLVGTARNGRQALEAIERLSPHIVVADINMPVMNGIELLAEAQKHYPQVAFIILTNLEEFALARDALRMRAVDYLTKTQLEPQALEASLAAAQKRVDQRRSLAQTNLVRETSRAERLEVLKAAFKRMLFQGTLNRESVEALEESGMLAGYGVIQMWRPPRRDEWAQAQRQEDDSWTSEVVDRLAENSFEQFLMVQLSWKYTLLVHWGGEVRRAGERAAAFSKRLASVSHDILGTPVYILATGVFQGAGQGAQCRAQLAELGESFYLTGKSPLCYDMLAPVKYQPLAIQGVAGRLMAELNSRNAAGCAAVLDRIVELAGSTPHHKEQMIWICGELYDAAHTAFAGQEGRDALSSIGGYNEIERLETCSQVLDWLQKLKKEICDGMESAPSKHSFLLEQVRQYVHDNVETRILLQNAADHVGFSPAYLSALFKKEYHQSFVDYVNQTKAQRACLLIQEGGRRMNEIGYQLGFENAYYFSRVFRRHIGMSPTEYQHSLQKGEGQSKRAEGE